MPVIPPYISTKKKRFIIGEPKYVHEMEKAGLNKEEIADKIKDEINSLYRKYILTDTEAKAIVKDAPVRNKKHYGEE